MLDEPTRPMCPPKTLAKPNFLASLAVPAFAPKARPWPPRLILQLLSSLPTRAHPGSDISAHWLSAPQGSPKYCSVCNRNRPAPAMLQTVPEHQLLLQRRVQAGPVCAPVLAQHLQTAGPCDAITTVESFQTQGHLEDVSEHATFFQGRFVS